MASILHGDFPENKITFDERIDISKVDSHQFQNTNLQTAFKKQ